MPERIDGPENWRDRDVAADDRLLPEEKELLLNFPNDLDHGYVYSDIPVFIKWVQSIDPAAAEWIRVDGDGAVIAISATIPKGIVKLQSKARKSDNHSQMVSYGPHR